ncbi:hypothetical protein BgiBS90_005203, partial [Biomphalaria glabrata]
MGYIPSPNTKVLLMSERSDGYLYTSHCSTSVDSRARNRLIYSKHTFRRFSIHLDCANTRAASLGVLKNETYNKAAVPGTVQFSYAL